MEKIPGTVHSQGRIINTFNSVIPDTTDPISFDGISLLPLCTNH